MLPANVDRSAFSSHEFGQGQSKKGRLVVVSNRVADLSAGHQSGGLAVAVGEALQASGGLWFGSSGEVTPEARNQEPLIRRTGNVRP